MSNTKVFTPIAASNHSSETRAVHDFYATDPHSIDALVGAYTLPEVILEPSYYLIKKINIENGHIQNS